MASAGITDVPRTAPISIRTAEEAAAKAAFELAERRRIERLARKGLQTSAGIAEIFGGGAPPTKVVRPRKTADATGVGEESGNTAVFERVTRPQEVDRSSALTGSAAPCFERVPPAVTDAGFNKQYAPVLMTASADQVLFEQVTRPRETVPISMGSSVPCFEPVRRVSAVEIVGDRNVCFQQLPEHSYSYDNRRVDLLRRESSEQSDNHPPHAAAATSGTVFRTVPDHDAVHPRAQPWSAHSRSATSAQFQLVGGGDRSNDVSPLRDAVAGSTVASDNYKERRRREPPDDEQRQQQQRRGTPDGAETDGATTSIDRWRGGGATAGGPLPQSSLSGAPSPLRQQNEATSLVNKAAISGAGRPITSGGGGFGGGAVSGQQEKTKDAATSSTMEKPIVASKAGAAAMAEPFRDQASGTRVFIKGGQIVNDDSIFSADIVVEDGVIKQIAPNLQTPAGARVIDASGKMVMPGGIDPNTHFQKPQSGTTSVDDFFVGTKCAVAGGTTTVLATVCPSAGESMVTAVDRWQAMAARRVCCNYALSVLVPGYTAGTKEQIAQLVKEKGVNSFVLSMAHKQEGVMIRDDQLFQIFSVCRQLGALPRVHAENGDVIHEQQRRMLSLGVNGPEGHLQSREEELEAEAVNRACVIAQQANSPLYLLHVTSRTAAQTIAKHRKRGVCCFGETTTAALATDGTHYFNKCWRHAAGHVVTPPLRPDPLTPAYLMDMLASGELHVSASDHCAFNSEQKALGRNDFTKIPAGANGAEERMMVVWRKGVHSGKMDAMRFVAVTSTNAAKMFNLYPKKGRVAAGADADLVIWDPQLKRTISARSHQSSGDFNICEGVQCIGGAWMTLVAGRIAYDNGQVTASQGSGLFVSLPPKAPTVFSVIHQRERVCLPEKVDRSADTTAPSKPSAQKQPQHVQEPLMPATRINTQQSAPGGDFHSRPSTRAGSRNQMDSSFSLTGRQIDDGADRKQTKIIQPPGGKSTGIW